MQKLTAALAILGLALSGCITVPLQASGTPVASLNTIYGKWLITSLNGQRVSLGENQQAFISFAPAAASASMGCNSMGFVPVIGEAGTLMIGGDRGIVTTLMACHNNDGTASMSMQNERDLSDLLSAEPNVSQDGQTLLITKGDRQIVLSKAPELAEY